MARQLVIRFSLDLLVMRYLAMLFTGYMVNTQHIALMILMESIQPTQVWFLFIPTQIKKLTMSCFNCILHQILLVKLIPLIRIRYFVRCQNSSRLCCPTINHIPTHRAYTRLQCSISLSTLSLIVTKHWTVNNYKYATTDRSIATSMAISTLILKPLPLVQVMILHTQSQ